MFKTRNIYSWGFIMYEPPGYAKRLLLPDPDKPRQNAIAMSPFAVPRRRQRRTWYLNYPTPAKRHQL
jgi:hypothetical protein